MSFASRRLELLLLGLASKYKRGFKLVYLSIKDTLYFLQLYIHVCVCLRTHIKKKYGLFPWPHPTFHEKSVPLEAVAVHVLQSATCQSNLRFTSDN